MALDKVYDALKDLERYSGKGLAQAFEEYVESDPMFKRVCIYALHPYKMYSIQKLPRVNKTSNPDDVELIFKILDKLATKRGATDDISYELAHAASTSQKTWEVVRRIVNKDLRIGVGLKTASKFIPELPIHEVCLCEKDLDKFLKRVKNDLTRITVSTKLDGVRCFAVVTKQGKVSYLSRNGKEFNNFNKFNDELWLYAKDLVADYDMTWPVIFDGEVCTDDVKFQKLMTQVHRTKEVNSKSLKFYVFDLPQMKGPLRNRLSALDDVIHISLDVLYLPHTPMAKKCADIKEKLLDMADAIYDTGQEGLVVKDLESEYELKRSRAWCKIVATHTEDLKVTGWFPGTGKYEGMLGGLYVNFKGKKVAVGSGFDDDERITFMKKQPKMIEVAYREITEDGSLRFPRFIRVREDKE